MTSPSLAHRVFTLDGINIDTRSHFVMCATKPFILDLNGYFEGKLLYTNPLTTWSDIFGYRRLFESDRPNEFVFVELQHLTAKMRLHVLKEEPFDSISSDEGIGYEGEVYKFADNVIAASPIARERLEMYKSSPHSLIPLYLDAELFWTLK